MAMAGFEIVLGFTIYETTPYGQILESWFYLCFKRIGQLLCKSNLIGTVDSAHFMPVQLV